MGVEVFLGLLEREASAVEFEAPLLAARAAGASADELATLEEAKLAALRVRALLERRARKEAELAALFDTASDLAGLRDVDAVLQAIVHRARRLLRADVAYISLPDPERGDTYVRVTDGSASRIFRACRLPRGAGLGGLVAQTGMPYWSADYFDDRRFRHTAAIDEAVRDEGIVAISGVPMKLGERVIGVLFASHRSARPYTPEEMALLSSLAAHAAIALDSARLLGEIRAALAEVGSANEALRVHNSTVERAAEAHDRMTDLVVSGGGVADIAAVAADILGGALRVLDADGRLLAEVGGTAGDRLADAAALAEIVRAARRLGRTARSREMWAASGGAGGEPLCTLVLLRPGELSAPDRRILERAAQTTAMLLLFRRSIAEAEGRVRGELLDDLLAGRLDEQALRARAAALELEVDRPYVLVVAEHGGRRRAAGHAATYASARHGLAVARGDHAVLLLPGADPTAAARSVATELGRALGVPVTAGGAGPAAPGTGLAAAYAEAQRCVRVLHALGRPGAAAGAADLGVVGLLVGDGQDVLAFLDRTLGPLVDYENRRGTPLLATVATYFATGCSRTDSAERLHIHVNTVTQRLDRVAALLGADWQAPERALDIQLALRLHRLRAAAALGERNRQKN
ncbi:GAF domain-containing protein [Nocardia sp. CDC159]|uniref:GAF domain-containing protein n=1 Tax=Nocardia pulmonis TaxID=2951408 RepID=A0A9X2EES1_9NOCA|nr:MULTISPECIES: GAF domain-containing protein [Nocardia]MCM6778095.1 GAF domain-containing protein [Nocardia pulmonis]MCM6790984.1 GAF domain-containing protein [Nocardia sp. CDC159]